MKATPWKSSSPPPTPTSPHHRFDRRHNTRACGPWDDPQEVVSGQSKEGAFGPGLVLSHSPAVSSSAGLVPAESAGERALRTRQGGRRFPIDAGVAPFLHQRTLTQHLRATIVRVRTMCFHHPRRYLNARKSITMAKAGRSCG